MYQKTNVTINWVSWENPRPDFHHKNKQCIFISVPILTGNSVHISVVQHCRRVAEASLQEMDYKFQYNSVQLFVLNEFIFAI